MGKKLEQLTAIFWSKAYFPNPPDVGQADHMRGFATTRVSVLDLDNSVRFSAGYVMVSEEALNHVAFQLLVAKVLEPHRGQTHTRATKQC